MAVGDFLEERDALLSLFPRGRIKRDEDDSCLLVALGEGQKDDFLYVQKAGEVLGLRYVGNPQRYTRRLKAFIVDWIKCDGEGLLHLRWCPEVAERLSEFTRGAPRGMPFSTPVEMDAATRGVYSPGSPPDGLP